MKAFAALAAENRRFPPPWAAYETDACFIVRDHCGQAFAYVYFEDEPGQMRTIEGAPQLLEPENTSDDIGRIRPRSAFTP